MEPDLKNYYIHFFLIENFNNRKNYNRKGFLSIKRKTIKTLSQNQFIKENETQLSFRAIII
jgi:hypothetical protein